MTELHHPGIDPAMARRNKRVAMAGLFLAAGMVGLAYASVPLYEMFCKITGFCFSYLAWRLLVTREDIAMRKAARTLFNYSLSYLFIVFFAFMTDNLLTRFGSFIW